MARQLLQLQRQGTVPGPCCCGAGVNKQVPQMLLGRVPRNSRLQHTQRNKTPAFTALYCDPVITTYWIQSW